MGEKIRDIGKFKIADQDVKIELNEGYDKKYSEYDIHIQSDHIQYSLTNRQFVIQSGSQYLQRSYPRGLISDLS